ncbi:hypothetical protein [Nocardia rhamnosiphila]
MTYQLSRLRMVSIGDRAARFADLTLDMSSAADRGGGPVDSILWLRNGGGKSSLLSLFFALLLPLRNDFMGKTVKRYLEDYVSTGDTSHTVAEWVAQPDDSLLPPARLVTGAVYEWADRRKPIDADRDRDKLKCFYYTFFAVPGILDVDLLPVQDDVGRLRTAADFVRTLRETAASRPQQFSFAITDHRKQWMQTLNTRDLDPTLFGYQKRMNHSEGGVAELFNFPSTDKFIDFLIELTTDSAQPEQVATNLRSIVDILGRKPDLVVDRDFCAEMAEALETLAIFHTGVKEAAGKLAETRQAAARLAREFRSASAAQQADRNWFAEEADRLRAEGLRLDGERKRINDVANELLRIAAIRRRDAAAAVHTDKKQLAEDADQAALAWSAVDPLAERRDAEQQADSVREQIAQQERQTAPLRAARDAAAAALKNRYTTLAVGEQDSEAEAAAAAEQAKSTAESDNAAAQKNRDLSVAASVRAENLRGQQIEINTAIDEAVKCGDMPDQDTDPRAVLTAARARRRESEDGIAAVRSRRAARPGQRNSLVAQHETVKGELTMRLAERDRLIDERNDLRARADALATHARLAELTQLDDGGKLDLWAEAAGLRALLAGAVAQAESAVVDCRADAADDDRALDGLQTDGFLPTTRDAQRVVQVVASAGVTARPGWELLRDLVTESARARVLSNAVVAELAAGVVVADSDIQAARVAVDSAEISAVAHVTVCSATQLHRALSATRPPWTVVPGDPALFDPAAAEQARTRRELARRDRDQRIESLHTQANDDRALQRAIDELLWDSPPGHLAALERAIDDCHRAIDDLGTSKVYLHDQIEELDRQEAADAESERDLAQHITTVVERIGRLAILADAVGALPDIVRSIEQLDQDADRHKELATCANKRSEASAMAERASRDRATEHRLNRGRYEQAAREITMLDSVGTALDEAPDTPLSALRSRFADLDSQWRSVAAESVLAERLSGHTQRIERADRSLARLSADVCAQAAILINTADGQDIDRRGAAHDRATAAAAAARSELNDAVVELKQAQDEVRNRTPRDRPRYAHLESDPLTEAQARDLAEVNATQATEMSGRVTAVNRDAEEADKSATSARTAAQLFDQRANRLADAVDPDEVLADELAYSGSDEQAEADLTSMLARLTTATAIDTAARHRSDGATQAVRKLASEKRFARIPDALRERFTGDDPEVLAERAAPRAREMQVRRMTLEGQLADIGRDQRLVVVEIAALVREVLANLESAHRHSKLPGTLGGWADQNFLRITFTRPVNDEDLHARIDAVVEQVVAEGSKPEGLALLERCVHESVAPRGFTVKVLKPNSDLAVEPVDVTHLGKFSGGEKLTVCVALYCTLARLRAVNRGRGRAALGGTLVLDNPLGTASHVALLRLQRAVAAAHGVQLIYTTGVEDLGAVGQFPNVLRMRNAPSALRTRRYVIVDPPPETSNDGITAVGVARSEPENGATL